MVSSIYLDDKVSFGRSKVGYIITYNVLTKKLRS